LRNLNSKVEWDLQAQRAFWNRWDSQHLRDDTIGEEALLRGEEALSLLRGLNLHQPTILELGCGNGWLAKGLLALGSDTGVDIADEAIAEARRNVPEAKFYEGDFFSLNVPPQEYDVVVTLEMFSHVPDQSQFVALVAKVMKRGGHLILSTQNRTVYCRRSDVGMPAGGQLRRWVTMKELRRILNDHFKILKAFTIRPAGDLGFFRVVNSWKLTHLCSLIIRESALTRLKEFVGWGQTLFVLAQKNQ
jgi:2-polyprenyl-3-methyl-5-hydroxy-6-metoxy-1,4-benzoquinol methylase